MQRRRHRLTLTKQPGNAETIEVVAEWDGTPEGWVRDIDPLLAVLDTRMAILNMRALRGAQKYRQIDATAAEVAAQVVQLVNHVDLARIADEHGKLLDQLDAEPVAS